MYKQISKSFYTTYVISGQPTIEEKALIFIKALDLGIKPPITSATESPSTTTKPIQHPTINNPFATQHSATRQPFKFPNQFLFQREKRQMQRCPTGVHKICQDSSRSKLSYNHVQSTK